MSLNGTLQVGKSALSTTQAAIQTVGNNIAGASDPNYTRQEVRIEAAPGQKIGRGLVIGTGVDLTSITRQVDEALQGRLRGGIAESEGAKITTQYLEQIEGVIDELGDADLSTQFSKFFAAWGEAASKPADVPLRQNVLAEGEALAQKFREVRGGVDDLARSAGAQMRVLAGEADDLAAQIADVNAEIVQVEGASGGSANALRDRRDALLNELSATVNVRALEQPDGSASVYIGSEPLVTGDTSQGVALREFDGPDGQPRYELTFADGRTPLGARAGRLGGTERAWREAGEVRDGLDAVAGGLIFELNKLHSSGQGLVGHDAVESSNRVADADAALDSDAAGLDFSPTNGSFVVNVRDKATGRVARTLVDVGLDGTGGGKSLNELSANLDAIEGVTAGVSNGRLRISADSSGQDVSFAEDTSGALAALGVGGFFDGTDARTIAVSSAVEGDPRRLAVSGNGEPGDNATARAIADLQDKAASSLEGMSLNAAYRSLTGGVASASAAARSEAEASSSVRETLEAQRAALSGVSLDEEAVALMRYQRSYQGAARLIAAVDEMMQTVLSLV